MIFFILMSLILFDIISTEIILKTRGNNARELNPILRNKWVRWVLTLLFKIGGMIWLFYTQITVPSTYNTIEIVFTILSIWFVIVFINNTRMSIRLRD